MIGRTVRRQLVGLVSVLSLALISLLSGCAAQAQPTITSQKANEIAASNRQSVANSQAKAKDASAEKQTGQQYQASNDHITGADAAALAVQQVLKDPQDELFQAIPSVNVDGQGHHYYQVDAFTKRAGNQRGAFLQSYFVYPDGIITTKQAN